LQRVDIERGQIVPLWIEAIRMRIFDKTRG
jgi:hypothetical protein